MREKKHFGRRKLVTGSDTVVVFVHGILGTPEHFVDFEKLVHADWSFINILLKGHGGSVKDFSKTTLRDWKKQVIDEVRDLTVRFDTIYLVTHSMGCLFSLYLSYLLPNKIKGLFFLAPPLRITLKLPIIITSLKIVFEIETSDVSTLAAKKAYSIENEKNLLKYIWWIPNFIRLFFESIQMRKYASALKTPCQVFISKNDELVLPSSAKYFKSNTFTSIHVLEKSQHFYYEKYDYMYLLQEFKLFLQQKTR